MGDYGARAPALQGGRSQRDTVARLFAAMRHAELPDATDLAIPSIPHMAGGQARIVSSRMPTVLQVAYPFAPVTSDAVGGAEQIVAALDRALTVGGHRSLVVACAGSRVRGELYEVPAV